MDSLYEAGEFVRTVQRAQGLPIAVVEEIAYENGWDHEGRASGVRGPLWQVPVWQASEGCGRGACRHHSQPG